MQTQLYICDPHSIIHLSIINLLWHISYKAAKPLERKPLLLCTLKTVQSTAEKRTVWLHRLLWHTDTGLICVRGQTRMPENLQPQTPSFTTHTPPAQPFPHKKWPNASRKNSVNVISQDEFPGDIMQKHIEPLYFQRRAQAVTQSNKYEEQGDAKAESNSFFFLSSLSEDWVVHFVPFKAAFHIWVLLGIGHLLHFN